MEKKLITVIITTYNRSRDIERAINSVLNQTYKKIELIVVDDNANNPEEREKTEQIVKKYENVKLIKNEKNLGGALSRNVGIKNAKGEFIAFLDDDDVYEETKIEKQYKCYLEHEKENVGLIYCYHFIINESGEVISEYHNHHGNRPLYDNMINCIASTTISSIFL